MRVCVHEKRAGGDHVLFRGVVLGVKNSGTGPLGLFCSSQLTMVLIVHVVRGRSHAFPDDRSYNELPILLYR